MITRWNSFCVRGCLNRMRYVALSAQIVDQISRDLQSVGHDIAAAFNLSKRTLYASSASRLVSVTKWVIKCYRLQEAVQQLANAWRWSRLAVDLCYFDQATSQRLQSDHWKTPSGLAPNYARQQTRAVDRLESGRFW